MVYNTAAHYRKGVFELIDKALDVEWYFGRQDSDIKTLPLTAFRKARYLERRSAGPFTWQQGVVGLIGRRDFDCYIMLGDLFSVSTWAAMIVKRLFYRRKRLYLWSHGWYGKETRVRRVLKKIYFRLPDATFLYGNHARGLMIDAGLDGSRLFVIHNSLDYERQLEVRSRLTPEAIYRGHFGNADPTLIFIGRLTPVKRLDQLIDAVALLESRGQGVNLVIVGDGAMRQSLESRVAERGLEGRVWFYGPSYDEADNGRLLFNADLCVSPGNVGLTAMHAMVYGTPVVTHDNFAYQMPEFEAIREGATGAFFRQGSVEALADAVETWLSTHPDREVVRRECYAEIDTSWTPQFQLDTLKAHL